MEDFLLTNVAVEDLLLRPSEKIDYARLEALVKNKAVIVTGGGGSIGSEICERVATFGAARLLVIENSEPALYAVTEALAARETRAVIEGRIAELESKLAAAQVIDPSTLQADGRIVFGATVSLEEIETAAKG